MPTGSSKGVQALALAGAATGAVAAAVGMALCEGAMSRDATWFVKRTWGHGSPLVAPAHVDVDAQEAIRRGRLALAEGVHEWKAQAAVERVERVTGEGSQRQVGYVYFADRPSREWAVLAHPYRTDHRAMEGVGLLYASRGFNVLALDLPACGESDGQVLGMGAPDGPVVLGWARYLVGRFGADVRIVLHGASMGASAVLGAAGLCDVAQVAAVVADSGFTSLFAEMAHVTGTMVPFAGLPCALLTALAAKPMYGVDVRRSSAVDLVRSASAPVLFLQGSYDRVNLPSMAQELYDACGSAVKELHVFPRMGHIQAVEGDPKGYIDVVMGFLERAWDE